MSNEQTPENEEVSTEIEIDESTGLEATATEDAEEEYTPNYSYSVRDEEREFDERFRPLVKSKDDEEFLRELHTRADGLDVYKDKLTAKEQEYEALYGQSESLTQGFAALKTLRDEGNFDELLHQKLGISEDALIDHALKLAQHQGLPKEERQVLDQNKEMTRKLQAMESKLNHFESEKANSRIDNDLNELKTQLLADDVRPVAEALQEKGISMAELVVQQGMYDFKVNGVEPEVADVVKKVAAMYGNLVTQPETITNDSPQVAKTLKTIKSTGSSASLDEPITSLEQLKRIADERTK